MVSSCYRDRVAKRIRSYNLKDEIGFNSLCVAATVESRTKKCFLLPSVLSI